MYLFAYNHVYFLELVCTMSSTYLKLFVKYFCIDLNILWYTFSYGHLGARNTLSNFKKEEDLKSFVKTKLTSYTFAFFSKIVQKASYFLPLDQISFL